MSSQNKERRSVNFSKDDFDMIKTYCNNNTLDMPKWLVKIAKNMINFAGHETVSITYNKFEEDELINILKSSTKKHITIDQPLASILHKSNKIEKLYPSGFKIGNNYITIGSDPSYRGIYMIDGIEDKHPISYTPEKQETK